jgi:DNA mismatch repair protein MutH
MQSHEPLKADDILWLVVEESRRIPSRKRTQSVIAGLRMEKIE